MQVTKVTASKKKKNRRQKHTNERQYKAVCIIQMMMIVMVVVIAAAVVLLLVLVNTNQRFRTGGCLRPTLFRNCWYRNRKPLASSKCVETDENILKISWQVIYVT